MFYLEYVLYVLKMTVTHQLFYYLRGLIGFYQGNCFDQTIS